jgi:hypothetical protein
MSHAITRRDLAKLLLALPAVSAAAAESKPSAPSEAGEFLAAHEPGLSGEERDRLRKALADQEKALAIVREFKLPADVDPALRFAALRSKR